ncbi:PorV/PorQ family protein [Stygiobacter electus]|uniref:PorV/PorQ family protein n=1 Tax=Stygiobacter electus TaxID=3032292 RepID=A0AAE3P1F5_9BACT|nr:PorV/PorQ family protein [Stygiobacter electus]MDF1612559.1 PorV/PorQ family protein [Stygiobacter electus]
MINKKLIMTLILAAFIMQPILAQTVTKTGTTAAKFLSIGVGARANAMGGAYSSVANDVSAIYWNPAGIASVNETQTLFTYTKMFADININYFGFVIPAGDYGTFGASVTALNVGDMDVTTEFLPEGTGEKFSAGSYAFTLSYAKFITENFAVGANVKYIRESIYNSSASGIAFDIGTIFTTPFYGIKFASSISNYGSKMQMSGDDLLIRHDPDPQRAGNNQTIDAFYKTDKFELPLRLQIGISRDFKILDEHRLTLAIDATHPNDNNQWVNVGSEISLFNDLISLRGGYKTLFLKDTQEGLTLGAGIKYDGLGFFKISVDYSYQQLKFLDNMHSFSIMLGF